MEDCRSMSTRMTTNLNKWSAFEGEFVFLLPTSYKQLIGSLIYLVNTRTYMCCVVSTLSQFVVDFKRAPCVVKINVLNDIHGTIGYGLRYVRVNGMDLECYIYSYWERSATNKKNTSNCFSLGLAMISCYNRKKHSMEFSLVQVEYMVINFMSCKAIQLQKMLTQLYDLQTWPTMIHCDNQSCIKFYDNLIFHDMSKKIKIICHFIRNKVQICAMILQYISIEEQVVDILTKPLVKGKFLFYRDKFGVVENVEPWLSLMSTQVVAKICLAFDYQNEK